MKKKAELFYLIKSMTKSEKRHFKLFSGISGSKNNYLRLFNEMASQEEYDEGFIKKKFSGEIFVNQLTTTKNYLRNLILKFLRQYHSEMSKEGMVKDTLRNVEILYQKGLYQMSRFEAEKAYKLSMEFDLFTSQFEALAWKKRILQAEDPQQVAKLTVITNEQIEVANRLSEFVRVWRLNLKIEEGTDFKFSEGDSLKLKMAKGLFNFLKEVNGGDQKKATENLQRIINDYDTLPKRKAEDPETYLILLNNLLAFHVFRKDYEKAVPLIATIKEFINSLKNYGAPVFKTLLRTLNIELEIYRESKNLEKGITLVEEINDYLNSSTLPVPSSYKISFWYQFANVYFLAGRHHQALKWINVLLDKRSNATREDLITFAHWLNLMVHFELKNYFVLRYFVESTKRFLSKRRKIEPYENQLLKLFTKVTKIPMAEMTSLFQACYEKFQQPELKIPDNVLDYIDFNKWIEEKGSANFS